MSALTLRIIACAAMLLDHIGYMTGDTYLRIIGRIAFPLFVYLIYSGFRHTSSRFRYAVRLAVFALISQVPFTLFSHNNIDFSHGNAMFTLLAGLLCIWSLDALRKIPILRWASLLPTLIVCVLYYKRIISSDYGIRGILFILVFYCFDGKTFPKRIFMTVGMLLSVFYSHILSLGVGVLKWLLGNGLVLPSMTRWQFLQIFSLGALIFIFMYNGKKGNYPRGRKSAKLVQYGFYAFYPLHQLILWLIRLILK